MMTLRGRSTARLCHPVTPVADEDREERRHLAGLGEVLFRGTEDLEEALVFGLTEARGKSAQKRMEEPSAARELDPGRKHAAQERKNLVAAGGFRRKLALDPGGVDRLATPQRDFRVGVAADVV